MTYFLKFVVLTIAQESHFTCITCPSIGGLSHKQRKSTWLCEDAYTIDEFYVNESLKAIMNSWILSMRFFWGRRMSSLVNMRP